MASIREMLSYCRPAGSDTESAFIDRYIASIPGAYCEDSYRNWIVQTDSTAPVLFSCHTDTVHRSEGRQGVAMRSDGRIGLSRRSRRHSSCLGADDTAGIWIMLELIAAKIPGTYVFHRSEERGGLGSSALADKYPAWLKQFKYAIAFDRRGTGDVITHQWTGRCCSNTFAESLALALSVAGLSGYAPCEGVFTDTANYTDLIAECTNLSVGYDSEHTPNESLDLGHLTRLRDALIGLDWGSLIVEREPGEDDPGIHWWRSWRNDSARVDVPSDEALICLDCGSDCDDPDAAYCPACGSTDLERFDDEDEYQRERATYLDATWAEVQRELRMQLKRGK